MKNLKNPPAAAALTVTNHPVSGPWSFVQWSRGLWPPTAYSLSFPRRAPKGDDKMRQNMKKYDKRIASHDSAHHHSVIRELWHLSGEPDFFTISAPFLHHEFDFKTLPRNARSRLVKFTTN
jgi:hypothetical protein